MSTNKQLMGMGIFHHFDPLDIAGMIFWIDASTIIGLLDGNPVVQWNDLSGNGNHLVQGNPINQPTYRTGIINGLPVVRGDGVNDWLGNPFVSTQPAHYFIVARYNVYGLNDAVCDGWGANRGRLRASAVNQIQLASGFNITTGVIPVVTNFRIYSVAINGATSEIRYDGVQEAVGNTGPNNPNGLILFADGNAANHANLDIAEVVGYSVIRNAAEIDLLENYLRNKYAL